MPGGGRPLFKGANAQSWAAMSLFLQHIQDSSLVRIEFEAEKLKDFVLVFSDDRQLVCESKAFQLTYEIITIELRTLHRSRRLTPNDEIVFIFICRKLSPQVKTDFKHQNYYHQISRLADTNEVRENHPIALRS
jgi:hypothetical protein